MSGANDVPAGPSDAGGEFHTERRAHPRVPLNLPGRYMLSNGEEFACKSIDVSAGGISISAIKNGRPGERVVIYLRELGRLEGPLVRRVPGHCSAIEILASPNKRNRIAQRIHWLLTNQDGQVEERRVGRRDEVDESQISLRTEDEQEFPAELLGLSLLGARIKAAVKLPVGARVRLGEKKAIVAKCAGDILTLRFSPRA